MNSQPLNAETMMKKLYLVPILIKALNIVDILQAANRPLSLGEISSRASVPHSTTFKILRTLEGRRKVVKTASGYIQTAAIHRELTVGIRTLCTNDKASSIIIHNLQEAADACGLNLLNLDNASDQQSVVNHASASVEPLVDVLIEFQSNHRAIPLLSTRMKKCGIPVVAVRAPHAGATYFGIDHYRAGMDAGAYLAWHAQNRWNGKVNRIIGLDSICTSANHFVTGAFAGARQSIPSVTTHRMFPTQEDRDTDAYLLAIRRYLLEHGSSEGLLVAATSSASVLGSLSIVRATSNPARVAIVALVESPVTELELSRPSSPLIGTVHVAMEDHVPQLIELALKLLSGEAVAAYNYIPHTIKTNARWSTSSTFEKATNRDINLRLLQA